MGGNLAPHPTRAPGAGSPRDAADSDSDESLIAAIGRGDHEALGRLYDRYHRLALSVAHRVVNDHAAAEDVVHDAFLSVWRRIDSFDPLRGSARGWLLTIVRNAAVDRRRGRHARALHDAPLEDVEFRLATDGEETFAAVAAAVDAERVQRALRSLPVEQREAVELAFFGGLTHQEIAERTGAALGTVKGRLRLGLQKLRGALADVAVADHVAGALPARDRTPTGADRDDRTASAAVTTVRRNYSRIWIFGALVSAS